MVQPSLSSNYNLKNNIINNHKKIKRGHKTLLFVYALQKGIPAPIPVSWLVQLSLHFSHISSRTTRFCISVPSFPRPSVPAAIWHGLPASSLWNFQCLLCCPPTVGSKQVAFCVSLPWWTPLHKTDLTGLPDSMFSLFHSFPGQLLLFCMDHPCLPCLLSLCVSWMPATGSFSFWIYTASHNTPKDNYHVPSRTSFTPSHATHRSATKSTLEFIIFLQNKFISHKGTGTHSVT